MMVFTVVYLAFPLSTDMADDLYVFAHLGCHGNDSPSDPPGFP